MRSPSRYLVVVAAVISHVYGVVYVTDLPVFSALAPCAASAVSYAVQSLTYSSCPPAVTALASCACTKNQNSADVAASISSSVLYSCGSTATEDVASASVVFGAYCNQGAGAATTAAVGNSVSEYITDLQAYSYLAPCAQRAISYAVQGLTNSLCPTAPNALVSCACTKNQNSLAASQTINTSVLGNCCSTCTEDVASAHAVFAGYCGLLAGTSAFPSPSYLAGAVSYYITDLPQFSSLAPCAASAVSYGVLSQTYSKCPLDPRALVSCACVKNQNSAGISKSIVSDVSYSCGGTATEDLSSALGVFAYYCSAGQGKVTPDGITVAAAVTTAAGGKSVSGSSTKGNKNSAGPAATGLSSENPTESTTGKSRVPIVAIGAGIGGAVVVFAVAFFFIWRYRRNRKARLPPLTTTEDSGGAYHQHGGSGKAELGDTGVVTNQHLVPAEHKQDGRGTPSSMHPSPAPAYSPASPLAVDEKNHTNVSNWPMPPSNRAEMPAGVQPLAEAPGHGRETHQQGFNFGVGNQQYHEAGGRPRPAELSNARPGANLNQGPVYEMSSF